MLSKVVGTRSKHTTVEISSAEFAKLKAALDESRIVLMEWRALHTKNIDPLVTENGAFWDEPERHDQAIIKILDAGLTVERLDQQLLQNLQLAKAQKTPQLKGATMGKIDDWLNRNSGLNSSPKEDAELERRTRVVEAAFGLRPDSDGLDLTKEQVQLVKDAFPERQPLHLVPTQADLHADRDIDAMSAYARSRDPGDLTVEQRGTLARSGQELSRDDDYEVGM